MGRMEAIKIFDTHAHYDDTAFDADRDALLRQMHEDGVERIVDIGCSMETSRHIADFVREYDFLFGTVGVHPDDVETLTEADMEQLRQLAQQEKILGIGEIGLDYHYGEENRELQKRWFARQLELAKEEGLPVSIHSRDAAKDTLDIMLQVHDHATEGVIHCFSYGVEMAREYLSRGYYLGVGGVVTFKNARKLKEVVEYAPLTQLVLETDAPYLAPTPNRGKRNCSLYLREVADEIARIKKCTVDEVYTVTYANAQRLYGLDPEQR